jgi:hypothetical protein
MTEKDRKAATGKEASDKGLTRTLKVELTQLQHALVTLAANLKDVSIAKYLSTVVAEAAVRDTQDLNKIRSEVDNDLKEARRKQ